jgi:hypothetical protein
VIDTVTLPALPTAIPEWYRGLIRPQCIHLTDTEDGEPRTVHFGSHTAGVAPCGTLLGGDPLPAPFTPDADVCPACRDIFHILTRPLRPEPCPLAARLLD